MKLFQLGPTPPFLLICIIGLISQAPVAQAHPQTLAYLEPRSLAASTFIPHTRTDPPGPLSSPDAPAAHGHFGIAADLSTQAVMLPDIAAPRKHLTAWLMNPNLAVTLVGSGILLIFLECNLPGAVLPGALGLLLLLSGVYGLSRLPLRPAGLILLLAASVMLALSASKPSARVLAVIGIPGLIYGLGSLVLQTPTISGVHPAVAFSVGSAVGVYASVLGRIAAMARRNKTIREPEIHLPSPR